MTDNEFNSQPDLPQDGGENNERAPEKLKQPFRKRLENFWYHYKWHSIIALFLVFTITICSLQLCSKESYDVYFLYAGRKEISRKAEDGDFSEYLTFQSSLKDIAADYDDDGNVNVSFLDLFMLSNAEILEIEKEEDIEVNRQLLASNNERFHETMMYSEYYLCFLSDTLYEEYKTVDGIFMFVSVAKYVGDADVNYYDASAIYLHGSGLEFATLPGICDLPENTVVCLRQLSAVASYFDKEENEENFRRGEESLRKLLATYDEALKD